jgi:hypothetical protein
LSVQRARSTREDCDLSVASADCAPSPQVAAEAQKGVPDAAEGLDADKRLHEAVWGLASRSPEFSAAAGLPGWQMGALVGCFAAVGSGALLAPSQRSQPSLPQWRSLFSWW